MISFILNDLIIQTDEKSGTPLLDFIRYRKHLRGTRIGCREGDCGACTVLEGRLEGTTMVYRSVVSCLMPLGNAQGKHIVSIEGLNTEILSPVQQAIVDHDGTQCGFCTPGFVVSLTGHATDQQPSSPHRVIASVSGNICRCTGYKSIERAAISISNVLKDKDPADPIGWLVQHGFLPDYFTGIPEKMHKLQKKALRARMARTLLAATQEEQFLLGGGTDLMVQKPEVVAVSVPHMLFDRADLKQISADQGDCIVGASVTVTDLHASPLMQKLFKRLDDYVYLIASEPIRNMGTLGGNICNASPIADLAIFFLALNSKVYLQDQFSGNVRSMFLKDFFNGYKQTALKPGEILHHLSFSMPGDDILFHFEKVSKRNTLDIASVNTAIGLKMQGNTISEANLAIGGVAPIPLFLKKTSEFLTGKSVSAQLPAQAAHIMDTEIAPISDIRGSEKYKRLLANRLIHAHFVKLFPKQ